jgi:signal transduction histidine kinase
MLARKQASVARERTFVSDASHELRTPLTMVRTELELIARDRPTGRELQAAARSAIEETDRLTRMADDLLLLSRADHGESALDMARHSAGDLLSAAARRAARRSPSTTRTAHSCLPTATAWRRRSTTWSTTRSATPTERSS